MSRHNRALHTIYIVPGTLESVRQVEKLADDTVIFHQLHKRVWPSTQRESLFCSHLCTLPDAPRPENMVGQTWMVCNFSTDHSSVPPNSKLIRISLHVGMVCQTVTETPVEVGQEVELERNNISCRIIYAANGERQHPRCKLGNQLLEVFSMSW